MGVSIDATGMGGQFAPVVNKIIQAESQPIKNLEGHKAKQEAKLKLFGEFRTKVMAMDKVLQDISTFRKFRELKADLGQGDAFASVTVDKDRAEPGSYQLEIDSLAENSSSISVGFEDPDKPVMGMGFVAINQTDGSTKEVYIDEAESSLRGIAAIINRTKNTSVHAAVIKDAAEPDAPWKLIVSSSKSGAANQIDYPEFYFLDGQMDLQIQDDKEAKNAELFMDGFPIELDSNHVTDFLPGVNLHLKQAKPDMPFTLTITEDYQKVAGKIKAMVDQVNQVLQFIYKQNAIDQNSDTTSTFAGDSTLQSIEYRIRNIFHDPYDVVNNETQDTYQVFMATIGIEFEKSGQIEMKTEKFNKNLEGRFDEIAQAFTGPNGIVGRLRELMNSFTEPGKGFLSVKEQGMRARIKNFDSQIEQKTQRIEQRKQDLVAKFSRLEGTLADMKQQQQYMAQNLGGGGGLLSQMGVG